MTEQIYNESYYRNYDIGIGSPVNYAENEQLNSFFKNLAKKIVEKFNPETVLDAGCALGLLVKELRALGVSAYGIDVSEYAVLNSVPEARPFCRVCSITEKFPEEFPKNFDLITNIEVMEHLNEDQCGAAIKNICAHTNRVLFSSTSTGFDEPTHINVQSVPYWAKKFAENGFYNAVNNYPDYISSDAYCFERCDASDAVERYETALCNEKREKETAVSEKQANEEKYSFEVKRLSYLNEQLERKINDEKSKRIKAEGDYKKAVEDLNEVTKLYYEIIHSQYWRITKPFRKVTNSIKVFLKKWKVTRYPLRALKILILSGPSALFNTIRKYREYAKFTSAKIDYTAISAEKRRREEAEVFPKDIKFSVLVPLYNTPIKFLDEMIESVKAQTYKNWELCLADGSDNEHTEVGERAKEYSAADERIVYRKLEKNLGISENTNACIDMSTGDYIALFDHDDILHPSALYENMKAIDFINFICDMYEVPEDIRRENTTRYAKMFEIEDKLNDDISSFSHGMKQKVALIAALAHNPKVLIMDEPFVGLDPKAVYDMKEIMRDMAKDGKTIFFSTHILDVAEKLCDRVAIIKDGTIVKVGKMKDIKGDESLEQVFLELGEK